MKIDGLRVEVRYTNQVAVVRPRGVLELATYATLRDTLLKCAAEQPEALLVQLENLALPSVHALTVFSSVAMRVSEWPGIPVLLISELESQRHMIQNSQIKRFVPVHASLKAGLDALDDPPARVRAVIELPPAPISTRRARYFVRMNCERWAVDEMATDAMAVVTSLVENTLTHTNSTAFLRLELRHGMLTIAVSDDDPSRAVLRERAEGGVPPSGLLLVAGIAKAWGCSPTMSGGKTVWAVLYRKDYLKRTQRWQGNGE